MSVPTVLDIVGGLSGSKASDLVTLNPNCSNVAKIVQEAASIDQVSAGVQVSHIPSLESIKQVDFTENSDEGSDRSTNLLQYQLQLEHQYLKQKKSQKIKMKI